MPILNYTTQIDPMKTVGEIQGILVSKGVRTIRVDYNQEQEPAALFFLIDLQGQPVPFRLPCNIDGVYKAMQKDRKIPPRAKNMEQAKRVAWRILKDWVVAQMAFIEAGQAEFMEVFMPYSVMKDGETLYHYFTHNAQRLLAESSSEEPKVINGNFGRLQPPAK